MAYAWATGRPPTITEANPRCLGCGYPLTGLRTNKCPECARVFDLADPETFGPLRRGAAPKLTAIQPGRRLTWILIGLGAFVALTGSAPQGMPHDGWLSMFPVTVFGLGLPWFVAGVAHLTGRLMLWKRGVARPSLRWHWLAFPLIAGLVTVCVFTGWVWDARWALSRSSFVAMANAPTSQWTTGRIGLFHVTSLTTDPSGVVRLRLGFPDWYSDMPAEFRYVPGPSTQPPGLFLMPGLQSLGHGWWIAWDPT